MDKNNTNMNKKVNKWIDEAWTLVKRKLLDDKPVENDPLSDEGTEGILTRQKLLDCIEKHFRKTMAMNTTKKGLLFHTGFMIYMNEDDYKDQEQSFGFTVKEAVNTFHEIIVQKKSEYSDYRPHARYWEFQFIPFREGNIIDGLREEVSQIPRGEAYVLSVLFPTKEQGATAAANQRAVVTVHKKDSFTMSNLAFNSEALRGVTSISRDRYQVDFNNFRHLKDDVLSDEQRQTSGVDSRATVRVSGAKFLLPDGLAEAIYMNSDNMFISGRGGIADTAGGIPVVRIDSDKVMDNQLKLRYDSGSHKLYFVSQSEVKLGERTVPAGTEKELYEGSPILINGNITLTISKIKKD